MDPRIPKQETKLWELLSQYFRDELDPKDTITGDWKEGTVYVGQTQLDSQKEWREKIGAGNSPKGFAWGIACWLDKGSFPGQLAVAMMCEFVPLRTALKYRGKFEIDILRNLPEGDFCIPKMVVEKWFESEGIWSPR